MEVIYDPDNFDKCLEQCTQIFNRCITLTQTTSTGTHKKAKLLTFLQQAHTSYDTLSEDAASTSSFYTDEPLDIKTNEGFDEVAPSSFRSAVEFEDISVNLYTSDLLQETNGLSTDFRSGLANYAENEELRTEAYIEPPTDNYASYFMDDDTDEALSQDAAKMESNSGDEKEQSSFVADEPTATVEKDDVYNSVAYVPQADDNLEDVTLMSEVLEIQEKKPGKKHASKNQSKPDGRKASYMDAFNKVLDQPEDLVSKFSLTPAQHVRAYI